ncbi:MAG: hypothetical protein ACRBBP_03145 [Bdellovibrionales bacterium]
MNNRNRILTISAVLILMAFNYVRCAPKHERVRITDPTVDVSVKEIVDQETSLTDAINNSSPEDQEALKEAVVEKSFEDTIKIAFVGFKDAEKSYDNVLTAFQFLEVEPEEEETEIDEKYIIGNKSVNGLRYFTARYEDLGDIPKFVSFELEPFDGAFEYAKKLVQEFYPGIEEPCYDSVDNSVAFRDPDGEHIISIYEITADNIDLDSMNPPRLLEDIGSVAISIEKNDGHHGNACGDSAEEVEHGYDHEGHELDD